MNTEHKSNTPKEIKDCWKTPSYVFSYYDTRFDFNYDLAASDENALCRLYCTKEDSALDREPASFQMGAVFCNPPFSKIMPWVDVCIEIAKKSWVPVVLLLPADTSVKWFKRAFDNCTECHFISGRLAFINAETGNPVSGNNKGSVVFIFDPMSPVKQSVHLINRESMR